MFGADCDMPGVFLQSFTLGLVLASAVVFEKAAAYERESFALISCLNEQRRIDTHIHTETLEKQALVSVRGSSGHVSTPVNSENIPEQLRFSLYVLTESITVSYRHCLVLRLRESLQTRMCVCVCFFLSTQWRF